MGCGDGPSYNAVGQFQDITGIDFPSMRLPNAFCNLPTELDRTLEIMSVISQIPRPSRNEHSIRTFIDLLANDHMHCGSFERIRRDSRGNLYLWSKGCGKGVNSEPVGLQGHLDMVCVAESNKHDWNQPIQFRQSTKMIDGVEELVVEAVGTTAGFDNALAGIALPLAKILDPTVDRPPSLLILTMNEEDGMEGVQGLELEHIDVRRIINLDNETEGVICLGSASSVTINGEVALERQSIGTEFTCMTVELSGFPGGHSGYTIGEGRPSANASLVKILDAWIKAGKSLLLDELNGGEARNSLAIGASAAVWVLKEDVGEFQYFLKDLLRPIFDSQLEFNSSYLLKVKSTDAIRRDGPITENQSRKILAALARIPHGVLGWDPDFEQAVESSNNLSLMRTSRESIQIVNMIRSSKEGWEISIQKPIEELLSEIATLKLDRGYPRWRGNATDPLVVQAIESYRSLFGVDPKVRPEHVGLEPGYLAHRFAQARRPLEMVSFGPTIGRAHEAGEYFVVSSLLRCSRYFDKLLSDLC